jgi:uncharacterized protein (DUF58 family)
VDDFGAILNDATFGAILKYVAVGAILNVTLGAILNVTLGAILNVTLGAILNVALGAVLNVTLGAVLNVALVVRRPTASRVDATVQVSEAGGGEAGLEVNDRNFPCQTLKIRNVSGVVMGS